MTSGTSAGTAPASSSGIATPRAPFGSASGTNRSRTSGFGAGRSSGAGGAGGGFGTNRSGLDAAAAWAQTHGGGTVAVESQSTAATAILAGHSNVAGIGGFSGLESSVTAKWIKQEVSEGRLKYILGGSSGQRTAPSDGRTGSAVAIAAAERSAKKIKVTYDGQSFTLYEPKG